MLKKSLITTGFLLLIFTFVAPNIHAKGGEYEAIVKHLKTKYQAKKVKIPFMWLARFAVGVVRPAGVKSFSVTIFEDLKFSRDTLDEEMQAAMRTSFNKDWSPILRVRSRNGEQVYMYMREMGKSVKIALVTIDKEQASIVRATFNPDKLAEFIENPKIFGISLDDNKQEASDKSTKQTENAEPKKETEAQN